MSVTATTAETTARQMLDGEALIGLADAGRTLPGYRGNASVHPSAVLRWVLYGSKGADGRKIKLEAVRLGNRWLTSREALARFAAALSAAPGSDPSRTPRDEARAGKRAADELVKLGA